MSNLSNHNRSDVLVIPLKNVAELYESSGFYSDENTISQVLNSIKIEGKYVKRDWAESTECVKQIVAYGVIRNGDRVLCLRRTKKSNREALKLRYTVLVGGHVDNEEINDKSPIESCLFRELEEELGLVNIKSVTLIGIVVDAATIVGRLHLGVIFDVSIEEKQLELSPKLDNKEFVNSNTTKVYDLYGYNELLKHKGQFDPWSSLTLSSTPLKKLLNISDWLEYQLDLPFNQNY